MVHIENGSKLFGKTAEGANAFSKTLSRVTGRSNHRQTTWSRRDGARGITRDNVHLAGSRALEALPSIDANLTAAEPCASERSCA